MRRIIPHRSTTIFSSFCAAIDGGRATIAATFSTAGDGGCDFLPTDSKPNVRGKPATDIFGVFVGQTAWAPKQLRNEEEEKVRRARGILVGDYGGRATQDDKLDEDQVNTPKFSELDVFLTNLAIQCKTDHEKYEIEIVLQVFREVIEKMAQDDELDDSTC